MLSLAVAGLWIVWYPPAIAFEDESTYLAHARILARGELTGNRPTDMTLSMVQTANGAVAKFPPGQPLLLAPTQLGGFWRTGFMVGLMALLGVTWLTATLLQRDGRSPLWAALVLLHPTLVLYARTLMSDVTAALVLTAGFAWSDMREPRPFRAGLAFGLGPLIRTAIVPVAAALGLLFVLRLARANRWRDLTFAVGGAAVPLVALLFYNAYVFGSPFESHSPVSTFFDWSTSHQRAIFYVVALNLLWPALAIGVIMSRHRRRVEAQLILAISYVFFAGYYFVDRRYGLPADFVIGLRFFVPILPILAIVYAERIESWMPQFAKRPPLIAGTIVMVMVANITLVARHQGFLRETATRRDIAVQAAQEADFVVVHGGAAELMSPAWGAPAFTIRHDVESMQALGAAMVAEGNRVLLIAQGTWADILYDRSGGSARREAGVGLLWLPQE